LVRFSDILGKISKKHGAKPTAHKPLNEKEFKRPDLGVPVRKKAPREPRPPGFVHEPTQEISKGIMERLFQSVLDTPPEAQGASLPSAGETPASAPAFPSDPLAKSPRPSAPGEIRKFRNHAELMKFASLLINDIEDALP
jgi:hypothetical protein